MAGRRSPVTEIREILRRLQLGERARRIARDLEVSRNTVAHYRVWAARHAVLEGGALPDPATLAGLLERGAERVAIVGADTPHVPGAVYSAALELLDRVDVVLGPATDGGYYLVAAKAARPELFLGVPMGTDAVLEVTLRRAAACRLRVGLLPPLRDLDRIEDLQAALDAGELAASPRTLAVATELVAGRMPA